MNHILQNVSLKDYSHFKIGGNATYFLKVSSKEDLISGLQEWKTISPHGKIFVMGGGTNILFSDNGFDGLVICSQIEGIQQNGDVLHVGSGVLISQITDYCIDNSLSGLEWAGGLPGTIGGAVRGNAGAFKGEIKDVLCSVESLDVKTLEIKKRTALECDFGYRMSIFKTPQGASELIISVSLQLMPGNPAEIKKLTQEKIDYRIARHPLEYPNVGSIFKNVPFAAIPSNWQEKFKDMIKTDPFPVVPTAKILVSLNLKGKRVGDAQVSDKHPNYIVNVGTATAKDVKKLIGEIKDEVFNAYQIKLEEEVMFV